MPMNKPVRARHAVPEVPVPAPVDRTLDDPSDPKLVEVVLLSSPLLSPLQNLRPSPRSSCLNFDMSISRLIR